jgi:hypothetical protein
LPTPAKSGPAVGSTKSLHRALLATIRREPKKRPGRVIVAIARALVERAADRQFDVPAPREHRIGGEIDVDVACSDPDSPMGSAWVNS